MSGLGRQEWIGTTWVDWDINEERTIKKLHLAPDWRTYHQNAAREATEGTYFDASWGSSNPCEPKYASKAGGLRCKRVLTLQHSRQRRYTALIGRLIRGFGQKLKWQYNYHHLNIRQKSVRSKRVIHTNTECRRCIRILQSTEDDVTIKVSVKDVTAARQH